MRRGARIALRLLAGTALVGVILLGGLTARVVITAGQDQRAPADAIVVLGAAQYDGTPSAVFAARLDHAAELFRTGVAPRVLTLGGGQPADASTEGAAGRAYLLDQGIDPEAVTAVGAGGDTLESLRAADGQLGDDPSVVVVTDPWHAARAAAMAGDLDWRVQVSSVQSGPAVRSGVALPYVVREVLGLLFYRVTGASSGIGTTVL